MRNPHQQFYLALIYLAGLVVVGVLGYMVVEDWPFRKALFMVLITISTIGYDDYELSARGQNFTIFMIIFGTLGWGWIAFSLAEGLLKRMQLLAPWRISKMIEKIENHYIVCGYGRIGREIVRQLQGHGLSCVVIEKDPEKIGTLVEHEILYVEGDATQDETLRRAGLERARGLFAVTTTDAQNIFITLSGRDLNPRLKIVARASEEEAENKLRRAGADHVISPYTLGGRRMASMILNPHVTEFLDLVCASPDRDLALSETTVSPRSFLVGQTLQEANVRRDLGVIIVGIKKTDGRMLTNPHPETVVDPHDVLIAIGTPDQLEQLNKLVGE